MELSFGAAVAGFGRRGYHEEKEEAVMSKIVLDAELRARLNGLNGQIEICDGTGATVGRFLPEAEYRRMMHAVAESQCPYSRGELVEMQKEPAVSTLAEFWRQMLYGRLKEEVSDEELAELRNQPAGRPLKEIWRSLGRS
jgi:hypothetical protein